MMFQFYLNVLRLCIGLAMMTCVAACGSDGEFPPPDENPVVPPSQEIQGNAAWPELPV